MAATIEEYAAEIAIERRVDAYPVYADMLMEQGHPAAEELCEMAAVIGFSEDMAEVQVAIAIFEELLAAHKLTKST